MTDKTSKKLKKRKHLPALIRYLIIVVWGAILSILTFYLLRKAGY